MNVLRINHVQVAMPRGLEDEARRFYGDVLGLREIPKPPALAARGGAWFELGDAQLHLGVDPEFRPARKAHVAFDVWTIWMRSPPAVGTPATFRDPMIRFRVNAASSSRIRSAIASR